MHWLLVAIGGGLGAVSRYALSGWILPHTLQHKFPWPTFAVNVLGCLLAGLVFAMAAKHSWFSPNLRLFLLTGVLGGFTTFSAFGLETFSLLKRGDWTIAMTYAVLSMLGGLLAVGLAYRFSA